jgi:thioredoxin 1
MKQLETYDEYITFITTNKICCIDFWAEWCGPCKRIAPFFEICSEKFPSISFAKINVDNIEFEVIVSKYVKSGIPLFIGMKEGEKVDECVGANNEKITELCERLSQL